MFIDAEYMNRWLKNPIEDISPKNLFDILTLIKHYKEFIVPDVDVSVEFPIEGTPCCQLEKNRVIVPYYMVKEGRVDATIGAMIHELHHIKWSDSEKKIAYTTFLFVCECLKKIKLDKNKTLYDKVFQDPDICFDVVFNCEDTTKLTWRGKFLQEVVSIIMFNLNALEDIRIDANTPLNLRKYIIKTEEKGVESYKEHIAKEGVESSDMYSLPYHLLFHHKGYVENKEVDSKFGKTEEYIVDVSPEKYIPHFFSVYGDLFLDGISELYSEFEHNKDKSDFSGNMKESVEASDEGDENVLDYLGEMSKDGIPDFMVKSLEKELEKQGLSKEEVEELKDSISDTELKEKEVKKMPTQEELQKTSETLIVDNKNPSSSKNAPSKNNSGLARSFHDKTQNKEKKLVSENTITKEQNAQIHSFENVKIYPCKETFGENMACYDTVIFDATQN